MPTKTRRTAARRKPSKATATRRRVRRKRSNPFRLFDVLGIALIFLCPITLIALLSGSSTGLFQYIAAGLRVVLGVGAWTVPVLLAVLGGVLVSGPLDIIPRRLGGGSMVLFLTVITWASWATPKTDYVAGGGGYLGDGLAWMLNGLTGGTSSIGYILLTGVAAIAVYLMVDVPLANLLEKLQEAWVEWRDAASERKAMAGAVRAKEVVAKPKVTPAPVEETVKESRKRTLASIFGRDAGSEDKDSGNGSHHDDDDSPAPEKPPVKILSLKPVKATQQSLPEEDSVPPEPGEFVLPPTTLMSEPPPPPQRVESELRENIEIIERTLAEFKVDANVVEIAHGPTVARYEIRLAPGIKVNKIVGLADNLAMSLSAIDVRVEAPIPGKAAIGVEVPNKTKGIVAIREIIESKPFREGASKLTFALGKDVSGRPIVADLAKMPHMLIGGATNSGKSIGLNTLIASLLFRVTPDECKFVLIDPKRVELSMFDGIPHLACPVVKSAKQAAGIFRAVVQEMEHRYDILGQAAVRNIDGYNAKMGPGEQMPYMVVVVDELCDLMMQAAAEVEGSITRIAQLARAVGIHLVIATQRPSVDVITGVIKANISSRIAFAVSSHHDSRTILDQKGAERLIGRGDMLFLPIDASKPARIQGCYVSEKEVEDLCKFLKDQRKPTYTITPVQVGDGGGSDGGGGGGDEALADEFYEPSVRFVVNTGYCSTSMLQRKFKIGYTRAARIVDAMEQQGIVGALDGTAGKGRQVLVSKTDLEAILGGKLGFAPDVPAGDDDDDYDDEPPPAEIIGEDEEEEE